MEIKRELKEVRVEFIEGTETEQIQKSIWETQKGKRESGLCVGSGVFTENCGLVPVSSQAPGNEKECFSVLSKSLMPWSQASW